MFKLSHNVFQELTTVPFRCVDEINQGLDERNERRVRTFENLSLLLNF